MSLMNFGRTSSTAPFRRAVNDIFESMERDMLAPWGLASRFPSAGGAFPAPSSGDIVIGNGGFSGMNLDFHETSNGFQLTADLPGMKEEDISVDVDNESGVLTVTGERKNETEETSDGEDGKRKYHFVERSYGKTTRSVRLPETADTANASAGYTSGVLTVTFPKKQPPAARRLQIPVVGGDGGNGNDAPASEGNMEDK
eukprot:g9080.t1